MPRGRKPAAAKMSAPKEEVIVLTKEQFAILQEASKLIGDARLAVHKIEDCETTATMAFTAGKAFVAADKAEDLIDDLIREINPNKEEDSWDDEDEDEDY